MSDRSQHLLDKAWFEAAKGDWLFTAPNPRVGALALSGGHIVGYGHHSFYGGPHAEEAALKDAGAWDEKHDRAVPGIVDAMVVTLEPCSTSGKKRPPCTQALIDAKVSHVLCGASDPDPRHRGIGLRLLEGAGIAVERLDEGEAAQRFAEQNQAFLRGLAHPERPWVLLKWASSLDGKLAVDNGNSQWITGPESRAEVHVLRSCSDAVAAGAGTLRSDNPSLDARPEEGPPALRGTPAKRQPRRILIGGGQDVVENARIFASDSPRVWVLPEGVPVSLAVSAQGDAVLRAPTKLSRLDLAWTLRALREEFDIRRLLVEGGARLHGSLLAADLVDAIVRYEAPILLGGKRFACDAPSFEHPRQACQLGHLEEARHGADLRRALQVIGPEEAK